MEAELFAPLSPDERSSGASSVGSIVRVSSHRLLPGWLEHSDFDSVMLQNYPFSPLEAFCHVTKSECVNSCD